jgi:N-acetylmuramoyl-L-alanine amidase
MISFLLLLYLINTINIKSNKAFAFTIQASTNQDSKKVILIDPGHGGMDGGTVSKRGTLEKNINLSIALKLRTVLNSAGYAVVMTREEDKGLYRTIYPVEKMKYEDLTNRCNLKRDSNCDLFISVHQNDFAEQKYSGAQVWYCKSDKSKLLAQIIQRNLNKDLKNNNKREEKYSGNAYKILRCHCTIPSIIVECGFLSNHKEDIQLSDEKYQQMIAESIGESINQFFQY